MERTGDRKLFKAKDFARKLNSFVVIVAVVAILIVLNVIADKLPWKYDMTVDKVFTLSEQSLKIISELKNDVNVVAFYQEGKEDPNVTALLGEYEKRSGGKIKVEYVDAERNPVVAKRYDVKNEGITNDNIVFIYEGRVKKVANYDIYNLTQNAVGKSFSGEQQFTGAISYVTSSKLRKVYFLEGHQETNISEELFKLKSRIESEAHVVEVLNLARNDGVPEDADVVVIASPKRDLSAAEKTKLQDYLLKGGRAIFMLDIFNVDADYTNFAELLKAFGVGLKNNFVVEESNNSFYSNNKMFLVPDYTDHILVQNLKTENLALVFPYGLNLEIIDTGDKNISTESILKTSEKSWVRYDIQDASPAKTDKDAAGPANLAVAVTKDNSDDRYKETRIVVVGNAKFIESEMVDIQGNFDLFMNAVNWVEDKKEAIAIRPKMLNANTMFVKGISFVMLLVLSVVVIPLAAFLIGLIVWMRRRHA